MALEACPHNIHHRPAITIVKDGSIWPSTLGRWHGAQLCTWSFHVWPSWPSNNNIPEGKTFRTCRITRDAFTSKVVSLFVVGKRNFIVQTSEYEANNHSMYSGITQCIWCWAIAKFSIAMGITCRNKVAHCSHAWIHTLGSSMLITAISSRQIEVGTSGSRPNNKKYGEKDEREAC